MDKLTRNQFGRLSLEEKVEYTRNVRHPDGTDYVECAICGLRGRDLVSHVTRTHKMKGAEYKDKYGVPLVSKGLSNEKRDNLSGDKNPWHDHGGKLSPWKMGSVNYSLESINKAIENRTPIFSVEWWLERGYTEEEYRSFQGSRYENRTVDELLEIRRKKQLTHYNNGRGIHPDSKDAYAEYHSLCWFFTNLNDLTTLQGHEKRGRIDEDPNAYHLDHIISISYGFNNNISPEDIGSIDNLRFIPGVENVRKGAKCA